jgi:hypothetical protein
MPLRPGENAADFAAEIADRLRGKRQYFPRETLDSRGTFNPLVEGSIPSHPTNFPLRVAPQPLRIFIAPASF